MLRQPSVMRPPTSPCCSRGAASISAVALGILFGLGACPGTLDVSRYGDKGPQQPKTDGGQTPYYDAFTKPPPGSDAKPISLDVKLPATDSGTPPKPDTKPVLPPDQGPPPPPPSGNPCSTDANCAAGLQKCLGINGGSKKCYNLCAPKDACGVSSGCAKQEVCVMVNNNPALQICYPTAVPPGGTCGTGAFCPNGTVCAKPSTGGSFLCRPVCDTVGQSCAGGTCLNTDKPGCNICM